MSIKPVYIDTGSGELKEQRTADSVLTPLKTQELTSSELETATIISGETVYDTDEDRGVFGPLKRYLVGIRDTGKKINTVVDLEDDIPGWFETLFSATPKRDMLGYNSVGDGGGGQFYWDADRDKQDHNAITIFSPTHSASTWGDISDSNWYSADGSDTGTGCWVRDLFYTLDIRKAGVPTDGTTDPTVALDGVSSYISNRGGGIMWWPNATYDFTLSSDATYSWNPPSNTIVMGESRDKVIIQAALENCGMRQSGGTEIAIENFTILGDDINGNDSQNGMRFDNSDNIVLKDIVVNNTHQNGLHFEFCEDVTIENFVSNETHAGILARECDRMDYKDIKVTLPRFAYAIQFKSTINSSIERAKIYTPQDIGIYCSQERDPDTDDLIGTVPENIRLKDCDVYDQGDNGNSGGGTLASFVYAQVEGGSIENCNSYRATETGIRLLGGSTDIIISGGNIEESGVNGIRLDSPGNKVIGTNIKTSTQDGLRIEGSHVSVSNVTFDNNNQQNNDLTPQTSIRDGIDNVLFSNCTWITDSASRINVRALSGGGTNVRFTNCSFINPNDAIDFYGVGNFSNIKNCGSVIVLRGGQWDRNVVEVTDNKVIIYRRDATPTNGAFEVGDRIIYDTPSAGDFIGEVCTVSGSPGTWNTYGAISS